MPKLRDKRSAKASGMSDEIVKELVKASIK